MEARGKQLGALGFCAFSVPAVLILPSVGWLWAGIASALGAVLLGLLLHLSRSQGVGLAHMAGKSPPGKGLLGLLLLWNLFALGAAARQLCGISPRHSRLRLSVCSFFLQPPTPQGKSLRLWWPLSAFSSCWDCTVCFLVFPFLICGRSI